MYTIREKQELTDALKDEKFFMQDLSLFQNRFPRSPMNRELARANDINRSQLCGRMIYALLDVVTEDEIKRNRNSESQSAEDAEKQAVAESAGAAAAGTGKQLEKQPQKTPAESKKKGAKKRSSRK